MKFHHSFDDAPNACSYSAMEGGLLVGLLDRTQLEITQGFWMPDEELPVQVKRDSVVFINNLGRSKLADHTGHPMFCTEAIQKILSSASLLVNKCLTSSNKKLLGAPGLTTRSKKLLVISAFLVVTRSY